MPAYVTIPQAIFLILQRIGQTPLQQVKSVRTAGQPTGAKAGLLATIISVAGFAYSQIPGVSDLVSNVGTYINDAIKTATGPIDQIMNGALSSMSFNPPATLFAEGLNLSESIRTFEPPVGSGLDFAGAIANAGTAAKAAIQELQKHTSYLSGMAEIPLTNAGNFVAGNYINKDMVQTALENKSAFFDDALRTLTDVGEKLVSEGKLAATELSGWIDKGVNSAHQELLKVTDGKMGLFKNPFDSFNTLDIVSATNLKDKLTELYTAMNDASTTQLKLDQLTKSVSEAVTDYTEKVAGEKLSVNGANIAASVMGEFTQRTNQITSTGASAEFTTKITNPVAVPVMQQLAKANTAISDYMKSSIIQPDITLSTPVEG